MTMMNPDTFGHICALFVVGNLAKPVSGPPPTTVAVWCGSEKSLPRHPPTLPAGSYTSSTCNERMPMGTVRLIRSEWTKPSHIRVYVNPWNTTPGRPFQTHLPYPAQHGIDARILSDAPTHQGTAAALDARPPASLKVQHIAVDSTPAPMAVEGLGGL